MENEILNIKDKITGEIYLIKNKTNNKSYIGQTLSHRKNKNKYRPFGVIGRFKDHISEAINNTKKNQCTYLNNAMRKYGESEFEVELLEKCKIDILDEKEQYYINKYNTFFPIGYNLTLGGKTTNHIKVENNSKLNKPTKRGREFGYVHKESTHKKMSDRLKLFKSDNKQKEIMRNTMNKFYDNKKVEKLNKFDLSGDIEKYIKSVIKKDTGELYNYNILMRGGKKLL